MTMRIKHIGTCIALAAVTLCGGALAANHIVDIDWSPDGRFAHNAQIEAGQFVEVCGRLTPGAGVRWRFTSAAPVDFNIHYHLAKQVVYPVKQAQVSSGGDTLKVSVTQDHCWMWTNQGKAPVGLAIELAR